MYYIEKTLTVSAAHHLNLSYDSKCSSPHGHNWTITVCCRARELNADGMVVDFSRIKQIIKDRMDHRDLNTVFDFNPTAENIAHWIAHSVDHCYRVTVEESPNNKAIYERDEDI